MPPQTLPCSFLRPFSLTKLWQGNVFTSMCQQFCPQWGRSASGLGGDDPLGSRHSPGQNPPGRPLGRHPLCRHLPGQTPPWADTSPGQTAPWGDTPPGQTPPGQTPPGRHPTPIRRPLQSCLHMLLLPTTANHTQLRVQDFPEGGRAPTPEVGVLTYFC